MDEAVERNRLQTAKVTRISGAMVQGCPHAIMMPEHYREDGTCRCDDKDHKVMAEWGYRWNGSAWVGRREPKS